MIEQGSLVDGPQAFWQVEHMIGIDKPNWVMGEGGAVLPALESLPEQ